MSKGEEMQLKGWGQNSKDGIDPRLEREFCGSQLATGGECGCRVWNLEGKEVRVEGTGREMRLERK